MTSAITTLPDLCLLTIFDSVRLRDLVNVWLTCRRWHSLSASILARRPGLCLKLGKSQTNFTSNYNNNNTDHDEQRNNTHLDDITWPVLTPKHVALLSNSFITGAANIHQLTMVNDGDKCMLGNEDLLVMVTSFSVLLHLWADKPIHTISLNLHCQPRLRSVLNGLLVQAIGSLRALRVLRINFWLLEESVLRQVPFPMLAQLRRLETELADNDLLVAFCRWVGANYANNHRLEMVFPLDMFTPLTSDGVEQILASGAPLAQFTGSFPEPPKAGFDELHHFLGHFPRLSSFSLLASTMSFSELSRALSQLPNLKHLKVNMANIVIIRRDSQLFQQHHCPLPSVRHLTLYLPKKAGEQPRSVNETKAELEEAIGQWVRLPHGTVFPGLRVLRFEYHSKEPLRTMKRYVQPYLTSCVQLRKVELVNINEDRSHSFSPEQLLHSRKL